MSACFETRHTELHIFLAPITLNGFLAYGTGNRRGYTIDQVAQSKLEGLGSFKEVIVFQKDTPIGHAHDGNREGWNLSLGLKSWLEEDYILVETETVARTARAIAGVVIGIEHREEEKVVALSTPSPVDMEIVVAIVAIDHETMSTTC